MVEAKTEVDRVNTTSTDSVRIDRGPKPNRKSGWVSEQKRPTAEYRPVVLTHFPQGLDVGEYLIRAGFTDDEVRKCRHWAEAYVGAIGEQRAWCGAGPDDYAQIWCLILYTWIPRRLLPRIRNALTPVIEFTDYRPPKLEERVRGECRGYRFTPEFRRRPLVATEVDSRELHRKRSEPSAEWERHQERVEAALKPVHRHLRAMAEKIVLTGKGAKRHLPCVPYLTDLKERGFTVDWQNRVHHPLVSCDTGLRKYLRIRGQEGLPLWSADVSAAQLQLLVLVLAGRYAVKADDFRGETLGSPSRTRGQEEKEMMEIVAHCRSMLQNVWFDLLRLIRDGDPYAAVMHVLNRGLPDGVEIDRGEAKRQVLCVLLGRPGAMAHQDAGKALLEVFPELLTAARFAASRLKHGALPRILQRVEARIVIGRVAERIMRERPGLVFYTAHDAIYAHEAEIKGYVLGVLCQEWEDEVSAPPRVKVSPPPDKGRIKADNSRKRKAKKKRIMPGGQTAVSTGLASRAYIRHPSVSAFSAETHDG